MKKNNYKLDFSRNYGLAENAAASGEFFRAAFFYKAALEVAGTLGDTEAIKECKTKLIDANNKSRPEFKEVPFEIKISQQEIEHSLQLIMGDGDLCATLDRISRHRFLCPSIKQVRESANETQPLAATITSHSVISDDGHVMKGGNNGPFAWMMKSYGMQQSLIIEMYLKNIFLKLIAGGNGNDELTADSLFEYLSSSGAFNDDDLTIIKSGLKSFFSGDYISAMHILIPRLESVFLRCSAVAGINIIALNQKDGVFTSPKTLGEPHLDSAEFQRVWGEDFCWQIKYTMFNPLGSRLRHKIAHGEISPQECNFSNVSLVLYVFLVIAARHKF